MICRTLFAFAICISPVLGALYQGPTQEVLNSTYDYIIVGGTSDALRPHNGIADTNVSLNSGCGWRGHGLTLVRGSAYPNFAHRGRGKVCRHCDTEPCFRECPDANTISDFENLNISVPGRALSLPRSEFVRTKSRTRPTDLPRTYPVYCRIGTSRQQLKWDWTTGPSGTREDSS